MGHLSDLVYMVDPVKFARERREFDPDVRQAEVLGRRMRRALLNCTRQWGKSTITAAKAVHRAYFEPESLTVVLSPSARQSGEFLRKAAGFARKLDIRPRGDGDNEISLLFPNGTRIVGLPGSEATVRGFSGVTLMIIDEAARVSDERGFQKRFWGKNGRCWGTSGSGRNICANSWTRTMAYSAGN